MDRRQFLLSGAAYTLPVPKTNAMAFDVFRNGSKIGQHQLSFSQTGDDLTVTIMAELRVTIAAIPVFLYSFAAVERWRGGVFQGIDSKVNFNGDALQVHAERVAGGYEVQGINHDVPAKSMARYLTPPNTLPLTYWNQQEFAGTVLNPQTAHSYPVTVVSPGWNQMKTADGGQILAQRFDVTGKLRLSVWYDQNHSWSGLEFQKDGDITYQKIMT